VPQPGAVESLWPDVWTRKNSTATSTICQPAQYRTVGNLLTTNATEIMDLSLNHPSGIAIAAGSRSKQQYRYY